MASSRRLLVVEDEPNTLEILTRWLESPEWTIETAPNAALGLIAARERPPFVIVSDVVMPWSSGTEFLKAIREDPALAKVPMILLTGARIETVLAQIPQDDPRVRLISKPPNFAQIRQIIKELTGIDGGPLVLED